MSKLDRLDINEAENVHFSSTHSQPPRLEGGKLGKIREGVALPCPKGQYIRLE